MPMTPETYVAPEYLEPPYSHNVSLDLEEQRGFDQASTTMKRLLVARWVNCGRHPVSLPGLSRSAQSRFVKITEEPGFEVLQELLLQADMVEEETRRRSRGLPGRLG